MERKDDSIYFLYPINLSLNVVKEVFQNGFLTSLERPKLTGFAGLQTFTEEDVQNHGVDTLCKKTMAGNSNTCVVLRIPKAYLGIGESEYDMSPIFFGKRDAKGDMYYGPMKSLIYGVYSTHTYGYIQNTNYSPKCSCIGQFTEEQKKKLREKSQEEKDRTGVSRTKYDDMLNYTEELANRYPETYVLENDKNAVRLVESFYSQSAFNCPLVKWKDQDFPEFSNRRPMTDSEFNYFMNNNFSRNGQGM